jgi:hypothetical protein
MTRHGRRLLEHFSFEKCEQLAASIALKTSRNKKPSPRLFSSQTKRGGLEEPAPEKFFELSAAAFAQRWDAGFLDMKHSEHAHQNGDISVVRRPRT